jgi:RES domain-containing protein
MKAVRFTAGEGKAIIGIYTSPDGSEAIYARSKLVHTAVRHALGRIATSPREVLVCSLCQEWVAESARTFFEKHATDPIRHVKFEPVRKA